MTSPLDVTLVSDGTTSVSLSETTLDVSVVSPAQLTVTVDAPSVALSVGVCQQGPPGPPGPIGPAGDAPAVVVAVPVSGHRVLASDASGFAIYADQTDNSALAIVGFSTQAASAWDTCVIQRSGALAWPAGGLTPEAPLFLTTEGMVSHTPPASGWVRQVAVAVAADMIHVDIGPIYWVE